MLFCLPRNLKQYLDTHVGTLSRALVTQLVLCLCASDKDLCVDESSSYLLLCEYTIAVTSTRSSKVR